MLFPNFPRFCKRLTIILQIKLIKLRNLIKNIVSYIRLSTFVPQKSRFSSRIAIFIPTVSCFSSQNHQHSLFPIFLIVSTSCMSVNLIIKFMPGYFLSILLFRLWSHSFVNKIYYLCFWKLNILKLEKEVAYLLALKIEVNTHGIYSFLATGQSTFSCKIRIYIIIYQ